MLNRHCACAYHVTCTPYVKLKYIFQFLTSTLPIHYATFIELRWRIRGVLSVTSIVKAKSSEKFLKSKNFQNFDLLGALEIRGMKSCDFYSKRHILAWIHVDWAILRENRLRGLTYRAVGKWTVSPLIRGLRYRAACDNQSSLLVSWDSA